MNPRERVAEILRDVRALPTLPDVAMRLLEVGEDPLASTQDMASVIERDPSLTARVLKLVNSPFFGIRREVTSVQQALMILGISQLRSLVLSGAMFDLFDRDGSVGGFSRKALWKHCVATAAIAKEIARRFRVSDPDMAFTAGLIHDVGKVVEDRYLHADFKEVVEATERKTLSMREAEQEILGVDHAQVGRHLAVHWNLPDVLQEAVGFHHEPSAAPSFARLAAVVAIANVMARELKVGSGGGRTDVVSGTDIAIAGLDSSKCEAVREHFRETLEEQVGNLTGH